METNVKDNADLSFEVKFATLLVIYLDTAQVVHKLTNKSKKQVDRYMLGNMGAQAPTNNFLGSK